jgi:hypothetical protein
MSSINFATLEGKSFPSTFIQAQAEAGLPVTPAHIFFTPADNDEFFRSEFLANNNFVNIDGGVFLSNESFATAVDATVYATISQVNASNTSFKPMGDTITIKFPFPVVNFSVKLIGANGLEGPADFSITDNAGDSQFVTLPNSSSGNNYQTVNLPGSASTTTFNVTITALGVVTPQGLDPTMWDFSINNISFNNPSRGAE